VSKWSLVRDQNTRALLKGRVKGGVQADGYVDARARWWSWGCSKCGEYDDQINDRATARREYKEHQQYCAGKPEV
jgi:hypothetical protein